jgi:uncharacterized protein involved in exopolysaccharide biosynthesis
MNQTDEEQAGADENGGLIDLRQVWNYSGFAWRAVLRHKLVVVAAFAVTLGGTAALLRVWPKTYRVEAKLLARRNDLMTSLSNPGRQVRPEADDPTRAASEMIHHRDNLVALIRQTRLADKWSTIQSPLGRLRKAAMRRLHVAADDDLMDYMVGMLEQRLSVVVDKEGVVKIGIDWPDARTASELVDAALQNFVAMRHDQEASAITEAIGILQASAASLQGDVDRTIAQLREEQAARPEKLRTNNRIPKTPSSPTIATASSLAADTSATIDLVPEESPIRGPSPTTLLELGRLNAAMEAKKHEIARLEGLQRQQTSELQARLTSALAIYTEDHPTVSSLRQSIASAVRESPELAELRIEAQYLSTQYDVLEMTTREDGVKIRSMAAATPAAPPPLPIAAPTKSSREPEQEGTLLAVLPADVARLTDLAHPSSRLLTLQLAQLANLLDRINGARLEFASSSAGLKYRYNVTRPAEVPKKPIKPNVIAIVGAGTLGALLLAILAAVAIDLASGLILESWQLEQQVGVPVLAVFRFENE